MDPTPRPQPEDPDEPRTGGEVSRLPAVQIALVLLLVFLVLLVLWVIWPLLNP